MKFISPKIHGVLDYLTIVFLAISPSVFNMKGPGMFLTYTLAVVHLAMTVATNFEMGIFKIIPLKLHAAIELVVSIGLLVAAILFRKADENTSFYFYLVFSIVLFFVWLVSDYRRSL
jgi:hypothetical protein